MSLPRRPWPAGADFEPWDRPESDPAEARARVGWDVTFMLAGAVAAYLCVDFAVFEWWLVAVPRTHLPWWAPAAGGWTFALVSYLRLRSRRRRLQVAQVRRRLRRASRPVFDITVQMNDNTLMKFRTTMPLAVGDFVEPGGDGMVVPANLLGSQRVIGVVVACAARL